MEQEQTTSAQSSGLIYKLNDRPPLKETLFAALQHLLAIFVAIITPPLIIAGALKLDLETTGYLVSMALFASGISTFIQCRRVGPIGCGLLAAPQNWARDSRCPQTQFCGVATYKKGSCRRNDSFPDK